jgi:futalosine hydrolase
LAQRWGAEVESMEGAAFARACLALGVRGAELRAISNPAGVRDRGAWRLKEALTALERAVSGVLRLQAPL